MDIVEALDADAGVVCVVGAGGKKTTLYTLARRVERGAVTATVRIPIFDREVRSLSVTDDPAAALADVEDWPVGIVAAHEREDRYEGYDPGVLDALAPRIGPDANDPLADVLLVKADGARTRWLKAPNDREPQLPAGADVVVPVVSARVVGEPLDAERVHRPDRVATLTGRSRGESLTPADVATVVTSPDGGLKDVPEGATVVPLVNMVDDPDLERTARAVAREILARAPVSIPHVVLARMVADEPLVSVVT